MDSVMAESYAQCRQITVRSRSSFAWSFYLLATQSRRSMHALYAYLRQTDDLVDGTESSDTKRRQLDRWEQALEATLAGDPPPGIWPALQDTQRRHAIPDAYLRAAVRGARMDLTRPRYESFAELEQYCDLVATCVGRACLCIWDAHEWTCSAAAAAAGLAIQSTNILRDIREDAERGRIYLPADELDQFDCRPQEWSRGLAGPEFCQLMQWQLDRVDQLFAQARPLAHIPGTGRAIVRAMLTTYEQLLAEIRRSPARVLRTRVCLPRWQRFWIVAREAWPYFQPREMQCAAGPRGACGPVKVKSS